MSYRSCNMNCFLLISSLLLFCQIYCIPVDDSLVISPNQKHDGDDKNPIENVRDIDTYEMLIKSNVSNRFATTQITSKVKNLVDTAKETTFSVVLPDKAFISEFIMVIGEKSYKAYVKEKKEAKDIYDKAVSQGQSAGHVEVNARDSNKFTVSVNVEPQTKITFLLKYEELLQRQNGFYQLVLNIHPGQIVKNLEVEVHINESRPLKFVRTPALQSGNEILKDNDKLKPNAAVNFVDGSKTATVTFSPDVQEQRNFAKGLGTKEKNGLAGQFIVQYDVDRDVNTSEILLQDGYFVHFFAPEDLPPLKKHVIFALDTSGSMTGRKIDQLKDAMDNILTQISTDNLLSLVQFHSGVQIHNITEKRNVPITFNAETEIELPQPTITTAENIERTKELIKSFQANGGTNIMGALQAAIRLGNTFKTNPEDDHQPLIIFLTDGEANMGISSPDEIIKETKKLNDYSKIPIFSLSFGNGADRKFLRKLSLENYAFSRHIYEAADAHLQLNEFYKHISSPLLSNVNFNYTSDVQEVTRRKFPIYFKGSELVVAGRYTGDLRSEHLIEICGIGRSKPITFKPRFEEPVTPLERLWAYLTIRQLLEKRETEKNNTELTKQALDLALKYSFVTDVSSLVVVKPNKTDDVNAERADNVQQPHLYRAYSPRRKSQAAGAYGSSVASSSVYAMRSSAPIHLTFDKNLLEISYISSKVQVEYDKLPWLNSIKTTNGSILLPQGTFVLEKPTPPSNYLDCPENLPNNITGVCKLLKDCPEIHSNLTDVTVYSTAYFCPIETKFAGVCCPKKNHQTVSSP